MVQVTWDPINWEGILTFMPSEIKTIASLEEGNARIYLCHESVQL